MRDLVAQSLARVRTRMAQGEETWVADPRDAWDRQADVGYLHAASFLTREYDLHRLRWMLEDPGDPVASKAAQKIIAGLAGKQHLPRAQLVALAKQLGDSKDAIIRDAGHDLAALLDDIPDGSLAKDWAALCTQMAADLATGAPAALARLEAVRRALVIQKSRIVVVGSTANERAIDGDLAAFVHAIAQPQSVAKLGRAGLDRPLAKRLADHDPAVGQAEFVGLVAPSTSSGVFENLARGPSASDVADPAVLDSVVARLYAGHGPHSLFMKTWAAGLAYSNGIRPNLDRGVLEYYAERCPLLPQTLRFVIAQLQAAKPDANIARYAIAGVFDSRVADGFEARAEAMSLDLAEANGPEIVRAYRQKVLALARRTDLADVLFARIPVVYGPILPGLRAPTADGSVTNFVIGPTRQLDAYQTYLRSTLNASTTLHRLYPRDFWLP